ncbi:MAG: Rpp14/Pop5 family protein [Candidatus Diapherotrites archaeon]
MKNEKSSLRPLPPTLRGKKRYILFHLESEKRLGKEEVFHALRKNFLNILGQAGYAEARIKPILFDEKSGFGVFLCGHKFTEKTVAALLFLKEVNGQKVLPQTLSSSGSLKKLKAKAESMVSAGRAKH